MLLLLQIKHPISPKARVGKRRWNRLFQIRLQLEKTQNCPLWKAEAYFRLRRKKHNMSNSSRSSTRNSTLPKSRKCSDQDCREMICSNSKRVDSLQIICRLREVVRFLGCFQNTTALHYRQLRKSRVMTNSKWLPRRGLNAPSQILVHASSNRSCNIRA